jgi:hypothetical protein
MPPLRPASYLRYRGYVCPSCIAKLQAPRKPPWLIRNAASQASQNGCGEGVRQNKTQHGAQPPEDKLAVKRFQEAPDGTLEEFDDLREETIGELKSRIATLEADLKKFNFGDLAREKEFINELLSSTGDPGGAIFKKPSPSKQVLQGSWRLGANKSRRIPPFQSSR